MRNLKYDTYLHVFLHIEQGSTRTDTSFLDDAHALTYHAGRPTHSGYDCTQSEHVPFIVYKSLARPHSRPHTPYAFPHKVSPTPAKLP